MALKKSQLYSSLWQSCDELRGGMDAPQYKNYILTLLFMKYVSDKYAGSSFIDDSMDSTYVGYGFRAPIVRTLIIARGQGAIRANIGQANLKHVLVPIPRDQDRVLRECVGPAVSR